MLRNGAEIAIQLPVSQFNNSTSSVTITVRGWEWGLHGKVREEGRERWRDVVKGSGTPLSLKHSIISPHATALCKNLVVESCLQKKYKKNYSKLSLTTAAAKKLWCPLKVNKFPQKGAHMRVHCCPLLGLWASFRIDAQEAPVNKQR